MKLIKDKNFNNIKMNEYTLDTFCKGDTLNIFSDASMRIAENISSSCYGSVAVSYDKIIDENFKINTNCTTPAAEIRGIRCSLDLALKYRYIFKNINIFSDSQLSIFTLRDYIYNWNFNINDNQFYINNKGNKAPAKNQDILVECILMFNELRKTNIVNVYHQKGHVNGSQNNLAHAIEVFRKSNNIYDARIDYNFIRYISMYNNYVDEKSRSIIIRTNIYDNKYTDGVNFYLNKNSSILY